MSTRRSKLPEISSRGEVDKFLREASAARTRVDRGEAEGRLVFAMDATASREPTWDIACDVQGQMFLRASALGRLAVQLCAYGGFRQFSASPWLRRSEDLLQRMLEVRCTAGRTQIARVLRHTIDETRREKVQALVFVGDCMEEPLDELAGLAGDLGLLGVPAFVFHEGRDPTAERAFREIARLTRGAYCRFDSGSAAQLGELLGAVAAYASGGRQALEDLGQRAGGASRLLAEQIGGE